MATVKIKGKEYPIGPTMWAQLQFKLDRGKQISELTADDLEDFLYYSWLCVKGRCKREEKPFEISFEDYLIYVENDPTEALFAGNVEEVQKKKKVKFSLLKQLLASLLGK